MKAFELRLAEQHTRNARHVKNLRAFVDDQVRFNLLSKDEQELIIEQLELQAALDHVLEKRLRLRNIPV